MFFNTLDFGIFLPLVFCLYWLIGSERIKTQNLLIIAASYVFYGWWNWLFLILIFLSTIVDYGVGLWLSKIQESSKRKVVLLISILFNLGLLGFFKYSNFFAENFVSAFSFLGSELKIGTLNIVLPVGISFYTFQTMSYTIDIYRNRLKPTKDLFAFMGYVSFFPQLVAGPIERASFLLPQFSTKRKLDYTNAIDGLRQMLWGLVKKVIVADNCASLVNQVFNEHSTASGSTLLLGGIFFSLQIYGDFSGYSDIAIGTARLFGFNLNQNFAYPFFSRNINELWSRWHISLLSWFRDYVYIPLYRRGIGKHSNWFKTKNILILFAVSGFWHGANWTFIAWGLINAFLSLPIILRKKKIEQTSTIAQGKLLPTVKEFFQMLSTFLLFVFGAIFFRSSSIQQAFEYLLGIFSPTLFSIPELNRNYTIKIILIIIFFVIEWLGREEQHALVKLGSKWRWPFRYAFYYLIIFMILWYSGTSYEFIYFQF